MWIDSSGVFTLEVFLFLAVWIYDSIFTNMIAAENKIEIIQGIANGVSVKNIAKELNISTRTIEKYLEQLRFEYKATATCHLVAIFLRKKIIK